MKLFILFVIIPIDSFLVSLIVTTLKAVVLKKKIFYLDGKKIVLFFL
jgi:hypothetical protein